MKNIFVVIGTLISVQLMGQVESNFSHFMLKPVSFNSAYAGSLEPIEVGVTYRNQWTGLSGSTISTGSLYTTLPIPKISSGVSLNMMYDVLGVQKNLYLSLGYAYQLKIRKAKIGFGFSGGFIQSTLFGNLLRAPEGDYESNFDHRDPIIPLNRASGISPYLSLGIMFTYRTLQIGYSLSNVIEGSTTITNPSNAKNLIFQRNHFANVSYKFKISKSLSFSPNLLFKTDFKENQLDINFLLNYKSKFDVGIGYRGYSKKSNESVIILLGVNIWKGLQLMYSYDVATSRFFAYQSGSHEVSLTYKLNYKPRVFNSKIIYNPRFL